MNSYFQEQVSTTLDLQRKWGTWRPLAKVDKWRLVLDFPPFSVMSPIPWCDASFIIVEFHNPAGSLITRPYSLRIPITSPPAGNFCLVVRNVEETTVKARYKLWKNVGEDLDYPFYNGETLFQDAIYEVWTTEPSQDNLISQNFSLETSILIQALDCIVEPSRGVGMEYVSDIFTSLPTPTLPIILAYDYS